MRTRAKAWFRHCRAPSPRLASDMMEERIMGKGNNSQKKETKKPKKDEKAPAKPASPPKK